MLLFYFFVIGSCLWGDCLYAGTFQVNAEVIPLVSIVSITDGVGVSPAQIQFFDGMIVDNCSTYSEPFNASGSANKIFLRIRTNNPATQVALHNTNGTDGSAYSRVANGSSHIGYRLIFYEIDEHTPGTLDAVNSTQPSPTHVVTLGAPPILIKKLGNSTCEFTIKFFTELPTADNNPGMSSDFESSYCAVDPAPSKVLTDTGSFDVIIPS